MKLLPEIEKAIVQALGKSWSAELHPDHAVITVELLNDADIAALTKIFSGVDTVVEVKPPTVIIYQKMLLFCTESEEPLQDLKDLGDAVPERTPEGGGSIRG